MSSELVSVELRHRKIIVNPEFPILILNCPEVFGLVVVLDETFGVIAIKS